MIIEYKDLEVTVEGIRTKSGEVTDFIITDIWDIEQERFLVGYEFKQAQRQLYDQNNFGNLVAEKVNEGIHYSEVK